MSAPDFSRKRARDTESPFEFETTSVQLERAKKAKVESAYPSNLERMLDTALAIHGLETQRSIGEVTSSRRRSSEIQTVLVRESAGKLNSNMVTALEIAGAAGSAGFNLVSAFTPNLQAANALYGGGNAWQQGFSTFGRHRRSELDVEIKNEDHRTKMENNLSEKLSSDIHLGQQRLAKVFETQKSLEEKRSQGVTSQTR